MFLRKYIFVTRTSDFMQQLLIDLKTLVKNNWKFILFIVIVVLFILNYTDIKAGFLDGLNNK